MTDRCFLSGPVRAFVAALGAWCAFTTGTASAADSVPSRVVDTVRSRAVFTVAHVLVTRVTGSVPILSGVVRYPLRSALPSSVQATLDPRRIASGDPKRDADLQGPDWFDTARYPTWTFSGTRIEPQPGGFIVHGSLAVHGTPQACDLLVEPLPEVAGETHFRASAVVNRHAFGMTVTRADPMVGGKIRIDLDVLLAR